MPRDSNTRFAVEDNLKVLKSRSVISHALECLPLPITPFFFSDRIPEVDLQTSESIYRDLIALKIIDEKSNLISTDPRVDMNWRNAVHRIAKFDNVEYDDSGYSELMHLAYAQHEICSEHSEVMMQFFENAVETCKRFHWDC
jgi:hypothetical protein